MSVDRTILDRLRRANLSRVPDLDKITDHYLQLLCFLEVANSVGFKRLTAFDISDYMREEPFRWNISSDDVRLLAAMKPNEIADEHGLGRYSIMRAGSLSLRQSVPNITFVDPSKNTMTQLFQVQGVLSELTGELCICDPYVDPETIKVIAMMTSASAMRVLSRRIRGVTGTTCRAFQDEYGKPLSIRSTSSRLHDRYIVHEGGLLLVGTSLNSLGKNQTFVINAGSDIAGDVRGTFDRLWSSAKDV